MSTQVIWAKRFCWVMGEAAVDSGGSERMVSRGARAAWSLHRRERGVIAAPSPALHAVPHHFKAPDASPSGETPTDTLCLERARPFRCAACRSLAQRSHASTQPPNPPLWGLQVQNHPGWSSLSSTYSYICLHLCAFFCMWDKCCVFFHSLFSYGSHSSHTCVHTHMCINILWA